MTLLSPILTGIHAEKVPSRAALRQALLEPDSQPANLSGKIPAFQPSGRTDSMQDGMCYDLDGTNRLEVESALPLSGGFTVSFWTYLDSNLSATFFDARSALGTGIYIGTNGAGSVAIRINDSFVSSTTLATGRWYLITFSYDGSDYDVTVDGHSVLSGTSVQDITAVDSILPMVGRVAYSNVAPLNGKIKDVQVLSRAISLSEVRELFTQSTSALAGEDRELWLKCEEELLERAFDSSGNKVSVTKVGFVDATHYTGKDVPLSYANDKGYTEYTYTTATSNSWASSGAILDGDSYTGDFDVEVVSISSSGAGNQSFGFVAGDTLPSGFYYENMDFMIRRSNSSTVEVSLAGTDSTYSIAYAQYETFRIRRVGTNIEFYAGETLLQSETSSAMLRPVYYTLSDSTPWLVNKRVTPLEVGTNASYEATYIPRDEGNKTKDIFGGTLQHAGQLHPNGQLKQSNCVSLGGSGHIEVADNPDLDITNNLTLFVRHKNNSASLSGFQNLINKSDSASQRSYALGFNSSEKLFAIVSSDGQSGTQATVTADAAFTDLNSDHSYGMTFDGTTLTLYRDGQIVPSTVTDGSLPANIHAGTANLTIGSGASSNYLDGTIYDARIFSGTSAPLTADQMLQMHNGEAHSFTGQTNVMWLPVSEGAGDTLGDASGNGNDGTLVSVVNGWAVKQDKFHYNYVNGFSLAENFWPNSEPNPPGARTGITSQASSGELVAYSDREVAFPATATVAYAYESITTTSTKYMFSVIVEMDDDSEPVPSLTSASGDFSIVLNNAIVTTGTWTTENLSGNVWRCKWVGVPPSAGSNTQNGIVRYTTQSAKGFRITCIHMIENCTDDDASVRYIKTTGSAIARKTIPALADGSGSPDGSLALQTITHPAGAYHNGCESKIDFTGGVAFPQKDYSVRDNLFDDTEDFSGSNWIKGSQTVESNVAEAPNGRMSADRINSLHQADSDLGINQVEAIDGGFTYTFSLYLKGEGAEIGNTVRIRGKRYIAGAIALIDEDVTLTGEWVRHEFSLALNSDNTHIVWAISGDTDTGTKASSCLAWGAKLEKWHEATPYVPATRPTLIEDWEFPVEMLLNTAFSGAVSGTPGTIPTDWIASLQNGTLGVSGSELTFSSTNARHFMTQPQDLRAYSIYDYSITVTVNSGTVYPTSVMAEESTPAGLSAMYFVDGVGWDLSTALTGTSVVTRRYITGANASSGFRVRVGMGVGNNQTGDATISNPSLKRTYLNPHFYRQITKNGVLHRVDRMTSIKTIPVGQRQEALADYVETSAL